jgi:hypothetical protein
VLGPHPLPVGLALGLPFFFACRRGSVFVLRLPATARVLCRGRFQDHGVKNPRHKIHSVGRSRTPVPRRCVPGMREGAPSRRLLYQMPDRGSEWAHLARGKRPTPQQSREPGRTALQTGLTGFVRFAYAARRKRPAIRFALFRVANSLSGAVLPRLLSWRARLSLKALGANLTNHWLYISTDLAMSAFQRSGLSRLTVMGFG